MKTLLLGILMTIQCKNPNQGVTQFVLKNDLLHTLGTKDIHQITHSKVKAEYWEVKSKAPQSITIDYVLADEPAAMYLDGKYQVTLTQKPETGAYAAAFYRRYDDQTFTYSCRKL